MKKIILLMLVTTFVFAGTINLTVSNCVDNGNGTVTFAVDMTSDSDLSGFQFTVDPGTALTSGAGASGGLAQDAGWLVQIGGNGTVLGFSMQGTVVSAQSSDANLTNLTFNSGDAGCNSGLNLVDAQPHDEISVWGITYEFGGHIFNSYECSDGVSEDFDACNGAGGSWDSVVLDYTWGNGVESNEGLYTIEDFKLGENFPNPFNPSTTISYDVATAGDLSLKVFNMRGQEVITLASGYHSVDVYAVTWNGTDRNGIEMPAGMYIYKLIADGFVQSNKMLFVK